ncbi:helix-turn-helix domain-containing protein [Agrobacterium tumefaciens]|uniref:helix-turn-helix domain-containing protein n=1 Tax=Agrobacterium tumefaciens TaxID=358 RepID=UPI00054DE8E4|nr:helix-turn-helix transcriptional regulator [Agrobacterium tumefaciens]
MNSDEKKFLVEFGERVRALRKSRGLSQEQLAHACGLDRTYVGGIERGERNITIIKIRLIASALNVPISQVIE